MLNSRIAGASRMYGAEQSDSRQSKVDSRYRRQCNFSQPPYADKGGHAGMASIFDSIRLACIIRDTTGWEDENMFGE